MSSYLKVLSQDKKDFKVPNRGLFSLIDLKEIVPISSEIFMFIFYDYFEIPKEKVLDTINIILSLSIFEFEDKIKIKLVNYLMKEDSFKERKDKKFWDFVKKNILDYVLEFGECIWEDFIFFVNKKLETIFFLNDIKFGKEFEKNNDCIYNYTHFSNLLLNFEFKEIIFKNDIYLKHVLDNSLIHKDDCGCFDNGFYFINDYCSIEFLVCICKYSTKEMIFYAFNNGFYDEVLHKKYFPSLMCDICERFDLDMVKIFYEKGLPFNYHHSEYENMEKILERKKKEYYDALFSKEYKLFYKETCCNIRYPIMCAFNKRDEIMLKYILDELRKESRDEIDFRIKIKFSHDKETRKKILSYIDNGYKLP